MSAEFSSKLLLLRQNAGLPQKQVAAELGISQALLSHYEKGIRECHLDFVVKAAEYYNVSTDYMLGADSPNKSDSLTDGAELPSDKKASVLTVLRALYKLSEEAEDSGEKAEAFFSDFFSVCVKKYLSATDGNEKINTGLCDLVLSSLAELGREYFTSADDEHRENQCIKTVSNHAKSLLKGYVDSAF